MEKKLKVSANVMKKLEELISWKLFYTRLARPDKEAADRTDEEIAQLKKTHNLY
jgi:hypothetical protein